jgi:tetratricopeptide (TPR) repeat protein
MPPNPNSPSARAPAASLALAQVPARLQQALALHQKGQLAQALAAYEAILRIQPAHPDALHLSGMIAYQNKQPQRALELIDRALGVKPDNARFHSNRGIVLKELGRFEAALASYDRAIALKGGYAETFLNRGIVLEQLGQPEAALASYDRAIVLRPDYAEAHNNRGIVLKQLGQPEAALASYDRAIALKADYFEACNNRGNTLNELDRPQAAIESYRLAIRLKPDYAEAHHHLSLALLAGGAFREGWREYEWRIRFYSGNDYIVDPRNPARVLPRPSTLSPPGLDGKRMLLVPDQGIGDELFFLRFAAVARQRGTWTAYLPSAKIRTIVQRAPGLDAVVDGAALPPNLDLIFSVGDLPLVLGMEGTADIPPALPLTALPQRVAAVRERLAGLGTAPLLGVTWRAGTEKSADARAALFKQTDISLLGKALASWPGEVLILQRNPRPEETGQFTHALGRPAHDCSDLNEELEDMLALLSLLGDYVGVSNTNMHLMAGLGRTARVLIPHPPEWRWMRQGGESPWFPGFRLYRETPDGNWDAAFSRLTDDLHKAMT